MVKAKKKQRIERVVDEQMSRTEITDQFYASCAQLMLNVDVFSSGPVNAKIVIIGEGPGETEVRKGLPFIGGAGKLLFECLAPYGITRDNVYLSNVVKRQISLSRKGNEKHQVNRDELEKWIGLAKWELGRLHDVEIIFAMGGYALEVCASVFGVTNWRGSVLDIRLPNGKMGKVVCTINPAYAQRELRFEPIFRQDCHKLSMVNRATFKQYHIEALINPSYREALAHIRDLKRSRNPVSLDIEVINLETACIGLGNDGHRAMCINWRNESKNRFTTREELDILLAINDLCESHRIVAQNGNFDTYWMWYHDWLKATVWFDTLLSHHTLYPRLPHGLGFLTTQYTNHPFYKDEGKNWKEGGDIDAFWNYNCKDVAITYRAYERMAVELKQQGLEKFFFNHVMRAQPHLVTATVHGVALDQKVHETIREQVLLDVKRAEDEFHRLIQEQVEDEEYRPNPRSPPQMRALYFDVLGLKGRGFSTDKANRAHIMKNPSTPAIAREMLVALNNYATEDKFRGTYVEALPSPDGRFRSEYKQYGVARAPGRLSSSQLLATNEGGNIQNQPVRARPKFVADPGCVFVYFDLKQAEAQVVGYRANIAKWKHQFAQARIDGKYDCHRALAAEMFKVEYDETPTKDWDENDQPTIRYVAKRCRHGLNYRMERFRLSEVTGLPYHRAVSSFHLYHQITPELRKWWAQEERTFRATKTMFNALGRRFMVIQRLDDDVLDSIIAYYPQSTIGDKVTRTWYMAEEDDDWPDKMYARVAIDVHDNLVALTTPKYQKTVGRILKKHAEEPLMISDAWNNKPEELIIDAELKFSYPTLWKDKARKDKKTGQWVGDFVEDKNGLHRWSHMKKVHL